MKLPRRDYRQYRVLEKESGYEQNDLEYRPSSLQSTKLRRISSGDLRSLAPSRIIRQERGKIDRTSVELMVLRKPNLAGAFARSIGPVEGLSDLSVRTSKQAREG